MIRKSAILLFVLMLGMPALPQSEWVSRVSDSLGMMATQYFYPSVLRALNVEENEVFNNMIARLRFVRVVHADSSFMEAHRELLVERGWLTEIGGFVNVLKWEEKNGDFREGFVRLEKGRPNDFLAVIRDKGRLLIVEIVGELQIKNIRELAGTDFGYFEEIMKINNGS